MTRLPLADDPDLASELDAKGRHVMEHGPRLTYHRTIHLVAKCPTGKHELHGGLGGMGVGEMWSHAQPEHRDDPAIWDALPVQDCSNFGIDDACPRKPMAPKDMVDVVSWRFQEMARAGANVRRWILLVEGDESVEMWFNEADREWALATKAKITPPAQNTADTEHTPSEPER